MASGRTKYVMVATLLQGRCAVTSATEESCGAESVVSNAITGCLCIVSRCVCENFTCNLPRLTPCRNGTGHTSRQYRCATSGFEFSSVKAMSRVRAAFLDTKYTKTLLFFTRMAFISLPSTSVAAVPHPMFPSLTCTSSYSALNGILLPHSSRKHARHSS